MDLEDRIGDIEASYQGSSSFRGTELKEGFLVGNKFREGRNITALSLSLGSTEGPCRK